SLSPSLSFSLTLLVSLSLCFSPVTSLSPSILHLSLLFSPCGPLLNTHTHARTHARTHAHTHTHTHTHTHSQALPIPSGDSWLTAVDWGSTQPLRPPPPKKKTIRSTTSPP